MVGLGTQRESCKKKVYFRRFWVKELRHPETGNHFIQTNTATSIVARVKGVINTPPKLQRYLRVYIAWYRSFS